MAYQMTVTLTDQEYQMLAAEAARRGEPPETLLRDLIQHLQPASAPKTPDDRTRACREVISRGKAYESCHTAPFDPSRTGRARTPCPIVCQ